MKSLFLGLLLVAAASAREGFGPGEQEWGYVDVRPGAHMFWWLYYTTDPSVSKPTDRPLVIWLQGGPGASSTGYGNFEELGPIDADLNPRNETWVKKYNVLFIDNPVGTGYSYVDSASLLTTNNSQIAKDLIELLRGFYKTLPEFENVPLYVASESYGGKMAAEFALELNKQQSGGSIKSNIKGVIMIDSWISPIDSVLTWAPYLLYTGLVDDRGYKNIGAAANICKQLIQSGQWKLATRQWSLTEGVVLQETDGVDFYNILNKIPSNEFKKFASKDPMKLAYERHVQLGRVKDLSTLMNNDVKKALNIPNNVIWGSQSSSVFSKLDVDFMKPVTDIVETVLNTTTIKMYVVSGQLDLIVDTPGTYDWARRIVFRGSNEFNSDLKRPLTVDRYIEGYIKRGGNFAFYWIDRAGHMVPADNPRAMNRVLEQLEAATTP